MVVFTCITNQKDQLQPVRREAGVRFVCFSDKPFDHPVWEYMPAYDYGLCDPRRVARMYKILCHIWFPDDITLWIDGRVRLLHSVRYYLDKYKGVLCARPHHDRQCVYQEAMQIKNIRFDDAEIVDRHMERVYIPEDYGLHETGFLIRRPVPLIREFNNRWWAYLSTGSKRDQLSFDVVAWEMALEIQDINRAEVQVMRHQRKTSDKL